MTRTWPALAAAVGLLLAGCVPAKDPGDCTRRAALAVSQLTSDHASPAAASKSGPRPNPRPRPRPNLRPRPGPDVHDCG
jgi:hypothetical protein